MLGLSTKVRWLVFGTGVVPVAFAIAMVMGIVELHPILETLLIPYGVVIGTMFMVIGHGFTEETDKPTGSGGVDGSPGMGESKKNSGGDGPFGGGGGGGGGDGGGGDGGGG